MPGKQLDDLAPHAVELAIASLDWSEQFWDQEHALLPLGPQEMANRPHSVRNSAWFALGLLLRNQAGDGERACRALAAVLDNQYDEPGAVYHGTFARSSEEPPPPPDAVVWRDYDPNWRQFIGTTLAIVLEEYDQRLPGALVKRIDRAIQLAVAGEPPDRCPPSYINIALMKAALLTWAGDRYGRSPAGHVHLAGGGKGAGAVSPKATSHMGTISPTVPPLPSSIWRFPQMRSRPCAHSGASTELNAGSQPRPTGLPRPGLAMRS